jgi:hypothetical protein
MVGIVVLGVILFFGWLNFTSPVNEAGREYGKNVRSYNNEEIKTMDHVFERLEVLDSHFNSATFNKVQGGEKREVTLSDIKTLFGEPDQAIEDVDLYSATTVYQYQYQDTTLNFHEDFSGIEEYVLENFTEVLYDGTALDRLLIDTMINHQSQYNKMNEEFELLSEENISELISNQIPTRIVRQSGWHTWRSNLQYYFDDGSGDHAPEEYLLLQLTEDEDNATELHIMERGYKDSYLEKDTREEVERKEEALYRFMDERESSDSNENYLVEDFSREFGDIARIVYNFRDGTLWVSWLIKDEEDTTEIIATIPIIDADEISDIHDLAGLEAVDFEFQLLFGSERALNKNDFIGSD